MVDTNSTHYLFLKRDVFYFSRHVPVDVRAHYQTKRIVFSLKTKSKTTALRASRSISSRLEEYWTTIRLSELEIPGLSISPSMGLAVCHQQSPLLSEALETYLNLKGRNKDKTFHRGARRNVEYVIEALGDRPIDQYTSADASKFRDASFKRGLNTASVKRNFAYIRAIINLTITEQGIDCKNAFEKTYIPNKDDVTKRKPVPQIFINHIKKECRSENDEQRWLLSLIIDTGMRLSEAVGLHIDDFILDHQVPHIDLKPYPWRPLKTKSSERKIPLVGSSLWAAKRITSHFKASPHAFPSYTSAQKCNGNSASAALNKWLKPRVPEGCVVHSFRHSFRDRLRAIECPSEMIDEIGGWVSAGVGQRYGEGYPLDAKHQIMSRMVNCSQRKFE